MFATIDNSLEQVVTPFSYDTTYSDIYDTAYSTSFVFVDDEESDEEAVIDAIPLPLNDQIC